MIEMQADELRDVRKQMGLTQTELANALGLSYKSIARMEQGSMPIEPRTAMAVAWLTEHLGDREPALRMVPYFQNLDEMDRWLRDKGGSPG